MSLMTVRAFAGMASSMPLHVRHSKFSDGCKHHACTTMHHASPFTRHLSLPTSREPPLPLPPSRPCMQCTPSRSAWLSGRHYHNLRPNGATSGMGLNTTNFFNEHALFPQLHSAGYKTAIFGKIHNDQSRWLCTPSNNTAPFTHIETECSPCGGCVSSVKLHCLYSTSPLHSHCAPHLLPCLLPPSRTRDNQLRIHSIHSANKHDKASEQSQCRQVE
jgi:hypothetical protein